MIRLAMARWANQLRFGLSEFNPYAVGGDVALAEVTFKIGDPSVAIRSPLIIFLVMQPRRFAISSTVNNYVMDAPSTASFSLKTPTALLSCGR